MKKRLGRPCSQRRVKCNLKVNFFKPRGVKMCDLDVVKLEKEELEAIRLKNVKDLDQKECAEVMQTSAATFQRILSKANKKIALALVEGRAIEILNN